MPLGSEEIDVEERKHAGGLAARVAKAKEHKPLGQTSPEVYPYTYHWIVGYNEAVDEMASQRKKK